MPELPWRPIGATLYRYFDSRKALGGLVEGAKRLAEKRGQDSTLLKRIAAELNDGLERLEDFIPDLSWPQSELAKQFALAVFKKYEEKYPESKVTLAIQRIGPRFLDFFVDKINAEDYQRLVSIVLDEWFTPKANEVLDKMDTEIN